MNKVAVFGNTGAGKSTTSRKLAELSGLPLHTLDLIQFSSDGEQVPHDIYLAKHAEILAEQQWLIDGFGCLESTWARLDVADTLVFIDLPFYLHFYWVTKRFVKGLFQPPEGWPKGASVVKGTVTSYRVLWLCHRKLTPAYRRYVAKVAENKTVYHLRSKAQIAEFLQQFAGDRS